MITSEYYAIFPSEMITGNIAHPIPCLRKAYFTGEDVTLSDESAVYYCCEDDSPHFFSGIEFSLYVPDRVRGNKESVERKKITWMEFVSKLPEDAIDFKALKEIIENKPMFSWKPSSLEKIASRKPECKEIDVVEYSLPGNHALVVTRTRSLEHRYFVTQSGVPIFYSINMIVEEYKLFGA